METFGAAKGNKKINPMWGAVLGTGVGTVTAVGVRQIAGPGSKWSKWSEALGLGAGVLSGLGLMLLTKGKRGRSAGTTAMAAAVLNNGIRQAEIMLFMPTLRVAVPGAEASVGGLEVEPTDVLQGNVQMGIVDVEKATVLQGGFAEEQRADLPQLVGANLELANAHIQGMGGPALSQYAANFGSTHFSK